jgi:hypothetical protein
MAMAKNRPYQTSKITEDFTLIEKNESVTQVLVVPAKQCSFYFLNNSTLLALKTKNANSMPA